MVKNLVRTNVICLLQTKTADSAYENISSVTRSFFGQSPGMRRVRDKTFLTVQLGYWLTVISWLHPKHLPMGRDYQKRATPYQFCCSAVTQIREKVYSYRQVLKPFQRSIAILVDNRLLTDTLSLMVLHATYQASCCMYMYLSPISSPNLKFCFLNSRLANYTLSKLPQFVLSISTCSIYIAQVELTK